MKLSLGFCLLISSTAFGQLYSSYMTEGIVKATGGPVKAKTEILLNSDSTFIVIQKSFDYYSNPKELIQLDSSSSFGKWSVLGRTLRLDFHPETIRSEKKFYDTYLIRKKGLKRITLKDHGITTNYKASGQPIKF